MIQIEEKSLSQQPNLKVIIIFAVKKQMLFLITFAIANKIGS